MSALGIDKARGGGAAPVIGERSSDRSRRAMPCPCHRASVLTMIARLAIYLPFLLDAALAAEPSTQVPQATPLRDVRVCLASDVDRVRFRSSAGLDIRGVENILMATEPVDEWIVVQRARGGGLRVGEHSTALSHVTASPRSSEALSLSLYRDGSWTSPVRYPGSLALSPAADGGIDIINHLDLERYVACVVAHEIWPSFDQEAYRVQAIISRTYVLYQMTRRKSARCDVAANQGAQVYRGLREDTTGRRAAAAAAHTRGLVCTWTVDGTEHLFATYYSAACGGLSQSASIFGDQDDIPPLRGGVACDYCRIAPGQTYRWGPVRIPRDEVTSRLVDRYPDLGTLGLIAGVKTVERTPGGRPLRLQIRGVTGQTHELMAEHFRMAIAPGRIRSSQTDIRVEGRDLVFTNGRGFGHGLGLCQWGMQGQAALGKKAGEIIRFYYPGSRLTRAY